METFVSFLLLIFAGLLAIPVAVFFLEVVAAVGLPRKQVVRSSAYNGPHERVAVLVPAHNESIGLLPTLSDIKAQLRAGDRLLIIADNCNDDTAAIAAAEGAEVIVRNDPEKIGKGYALEFGLRYLNSNPPDIVVVIDADCRLADGTINRLSTICALTGRPVQGLDLMHAPAASAINYQVAEFAWRVKNWVRPLGLSALGLPCQLMGTGMAFPWPIIYSTKLASGHIVEDLKLGVDLAVAGNLPIFCPSACVTSRFPATVAAADRQRQRWEHGHLHMILSGAPRLLFSAIKRRNGGLLALALDLAVPPLVLLGLLVTGIFFVTVFAAWLMGSYLPLVIGAGNFAALATALFLSWIAFGRDILPVRALWSAFYYAFSKLGLYGRFLSGGRVSRWVRTDRE